MLEQVDFTAEQAAMLTPLLKLLVSTVVLVAAVLIIAPLVRALSVKMCLRRSCAANGWYSRATR